MSRLIIESLRAGLVALVISVLIALIIHSLFASSGDLGWALKLIVFVSFFSGAISWFCSAQQAQRRHH